VKRRYQVGLLLAALIVGVGLPVIAGGRDMLLCLPGFPGTPSQAQPYIEKVLRHLEGKLGWEAGSMKGAYLPDGAKAGTRLKGDRPGIALVGPSVYAANHGALDMTVIAKVVAGGRGQQTYSVVTAKSGPSDLSGLAGQRVSGAVVHDAKYVYNVVLDKQVPSGSLTLKTQKRPLSSLRDVVRGKAAAAIVDQAVIDHLGELEFAADLQVIYTSKPVPPPAAVLIGEGKAHKAQLKQVLVGMCATPDGKELCKTLTIDSIEAASDKDYKRLLKLYNR
jgi:ABC-type phosphate/phosphonate transport system substrate-binding protein